MEATMIGEPGERVRCRETPELHLVAVRNGHERGRHHQADAAEYEQRRALYAGRRCCDDAGPENAQPHRHSKQQPAAKGAGGSGPPEAHEGCPVKQHPPLVSRSARRGVRLSVGGTGTLSAMELAGAFQEIVDSLPDDWTDLQIDLRVFDEERYIDAAVLLTQVNAQPYSRADWHWRLLVAHRFGHAAAAETVKGTLALLDREGIEGEMVVRDLREGRAEVVQMWGRPESVRQEFRRRRNL